VRYFLLVFEEADVGYLEQFGAALTTDGGIFTGAHCEEEGADDELGDGKVEGCVGNGGYLANDRWW
jgi:hypothetical protein